MKKTQNTEKEKIMIHKYTTATATSVNEFYARPSYYKQLAEKRIIEKMIDDGGYGYYITGGNSCTFSCGYLLERQDGLHLIYYTACNKYDILIIE